MIEPSAVLGALALALFVAQEAPAQLVSKLEAGALVQTRDDTPLPENGFSVSPAIEYAHRRGSLAARGSAWRIGQDWQLASGEARGRFLTPTRFGLYGELAASANRVSYEPELRSDQLDGQVRVHMPFRHGGIWVGGGLERPLRMAVTSSVDVTSGGAWTRIGAATLSGSITNFYFTKLAALQDSASAGTACRTTAAQLPTSGASATPMAQSGGEECWRQSQFRDVQGAFEWASNLVEITAQAGYRFGNVVDVTPESRRWGSVAATYWLSSQIALVLGHARQPASPSRGLPARSFTHAGIVLAYWPLPHQTVSVASRSAVASFEMRTAHMEERTIVIRAGGIESVEIMGDFTDWEPRALTRLGRDHWEVTLPIPAGVHEINVRLDHGKWRSPPGVPTRRDGFNGEVGVLVVE